MIWADGELIEVEALRGQISPGGDLAYEGLRCHGADGGTALFRWEEHVERFFRSAQACGLPLPFSGEGILRGVGDLLRAKGLGQAYIRLEALSPRDSGRRAIVAINAEDRASFYREGGPYRGRAVEEEGVAVLIHRGEKRHEGQIPLLRVKGSRGVSSFHIGQQARSRGYATALLLYGEDWVAEAAEANLFYVQGGGLKTVPASSPVLVGITRDTVMELARSEQIGCQEEPIRAPELSRAEEIFLAGTAVGLVPVVRVGEEAVGEGRPGPLTRQVQDLYQKAVLGKVPRHRRWLTPLT